VGRVWGFVGAGCGCECGALGGVAGAAVGGEAVGVIGEV